MMYYYGYPCSKVIKINLTFTSSNIKVMNKLLPQ